MCNLLLLYKFDKKMILFYNTYKRSKRMSIISLDDIKIIKKDGTLESFNMDKVIKAIKKSSERVLNKLTDKQIEDICFKVKSEVLNEGKNVDISEIHNIVETILSSVNEDVAKSYRDYRNYKQDFVHMLDKVYQENQRIMFIGDKENANIDSTLVSTKRALVYNELSKEMYKKFFLTKEELQASNDGYIYIHDMSARLNTMNCCLFDITNILKGGFEMGNLKYNEPQSLDVAFDVIGDIIMNMSAQQYGGASFAEIDSVLEPYAEKTYQKAYKKYLNIGIDKELSNTLALDDVEKEFRQGWQALECKLNTVGSSRGDTPFVSVTCGLSLKRFGRMCNEIMLKTRMNGQGTEDNKKPVIFPKIIFLYDKKLHGEGGELKYLYDLGVECSKKAMYPDWLSLTGEGYVASMYKKYGQVVSPMGCRAFLSPWYERGGMHPADENDTPVFVGRFNIGAISLHLPMIYMKAKQENKDFYEVLDYYLNLIRKLHIRTYEYLGEMKASTNPLGYCEGGFYGGNLNPSDKIKSLLKPMTASFGITALNELQQLYNHKSLVEDGQFAIEVMEYINKKVEEFKEEDGWLYALYGTPAESLAEKQVYQFRKKYGIIENVSDRLYVSNSFHCHVTENITPIEKQNYEKRFWNLFNGGKIQYVKYPIDYNTEAIKTILNRAMDMGFYEGVNLSLSYCDDCGHQELDMDVCPKCGSNNITSINRVTGYLGYSRLKGDTRFNKGKLAEVKDRVSM